MTRRMYRYEVPVDGRAHACDLAAGVEPVAVAVAVNAGLPGGPSLEFWIEHDDTKPDVRRWYQVFGTGHPIPDTAAWAGTAGRDRHGLVWHLYETFDQDGAL